MILWVFHLLFSNIRDLALNTSEQYSQNPSYSYHLKFTLCFIISKVGNIHKMWGLNPFLSKCNTLHISLVAYGVHMITIRQIILWISLCSHQAITTFQILFQLPSKLPQCTWRMPRPHNMVACGSCQAIHTGPYTFYKVIARMLHGLTGFTSCYMLSFKIIL